jgi:hypothetical protein
LISCGWYTKTPKTGAALRTKREKINEVGQEDLFDPVRDAPPAHAAKPKNRRRCSAPEYPGSWE